jgi:hypothetical protein
MSSKIKKSGASISVMALAVLLVWPLMACKKKQPNQLTEESIRKFYDGEIAALERNDTNAFCSMFADHAEIKLIKFGQSGSEKTSPSKDEFCQMVEKSFQQTKAVGLTYSAKLDIKNITIASDGKSADVLSTMTEKLQKGEKSSVVQSEQSEHIELTGQIPLITQSTSRYSK